MSEGDGHEPMSRRQLLGNGLALGLAGVAGAQALNIPSAFGSTRGPTARSSVRGLLGPSRSLRAPGSRPYPHLPAGTDTLPQIEHIIVLMMENHSFDDHLGLLGRGDGLTLGTNGHPVNYNPDPNGGYIRSFRMPSTCQPENDGPTQSWNASHISFDNGTNLGFVKASGPVAMGHWIRADLPFYYSMARKFPISDRYFSSVLAQTYPNRRFLIAGTALGNVSTDSSGISKTLPPNGTIFDQLDAQGISWKNYFPDVPTCALFLPVYQRNQTTGRLAHINGFLQDAANGTLPSFSIVDPFVVLSEENGDISVGEAYAAKIINAVLESPVWEKTALIWTYDEHGGYYDHVPPPPAIKPDNVPPEINVPPDQPGGYDRYGFRVPFCMVSAWSKADYVSHQVCDHTSILKLVETKWNLPALTYRDANAHNMLDFFDFTTKTPPFIEPPRLAKPLNANDPIAGTPTPICVAAPNSAFPPRGSHLKKPSKGSHRPRRG